MTWHPNAKKYWRLPPGRARERLKAETAPKPKAQRPPNWRREKGPAWIRRGTGWVASSFRRVEFGDDQADKLWAECKAICPLWAPAAAKPRITSLGNLTIDYRGQSFLIPVITPSDVAFAIRQCRYLDMQLEQQCGTTE